jgi:hypothetical protein
VDKCFTPSDSKKKDGKKKTGKRMPKSNNIRIVDGYTFYGLATGIDDALTKLYLSIPDVLLKIDNNSSVKIKDTILFKELFDKAYPYSVDK